jgi:hypothetical protein
MPPLRGRVASVRTHRAKTTLLYGDEIPQGERLASPDVTGARRRLAEMRPRLIAFWAGRSDEFVAAVES